MAIKRFAVFALSMLIIGSSGLALAQNVQIPKVQQQLSPSLNQQVRPPVNQQQFPRGRPCNMTSLNTFAQAPNGEVFIHGTNLSEQCLVSFNTPYVKNYRVQKSVLMTSTSLKVWVPPLANGGTGTINMRDINNQYPEIQLPFLVVEGQGPACEIRNVTPNAAAANADVTIEGKNLGTLCTISLRDSSGVTHNATVTYVDPMKMKIKVPAAAAAGGAGIYTKVINATGPGFGPWTFQVIGGGGSACEITSLAQTSAKAGDRITVNGKNIIGSCAVIVDDSTKKRFTIPLQQPINATSATIQLPTGLASGSAVVSLINQSGAQSGVISGPRGFPLQITPVKGELTSVSPEFAPIKAFVILNGYQLDQNSPVYFKSLVSGRVEQAYTTTDKYGFKAQVPYELPIGKATIEARQYYGQKTSGREIPFEIVSPTPALQSLTPVSTLPGTNRITVQGTNFDYLATSKAIIELPSSEKFDIPTGNNSATKFDLMVIPDIYKGYNITAKNAEHRQRMMQGKTFYVQRGNVISNRLPLNIRSPYPILDQSALSDVHPGDIITLSGGNWEPAAIVNYTVNFHLPGRIYQAKPILFAYAPPSIPVPNIPGVSLVGMFSVKVPDVFASASQSEQDAINSSTVQISIFGPNTLNSNKVDIKIRKKAAASATIPTGSCPGGKYFSDYQYMGQPSCSGVLGAYLQCDQSGYYCKSSNGRFPAACSQWGSGVGSNVGPLVRDGIFYGCYKIK